MSKSVHRSGQKLLLSRRNEDVTTQEVVMQLQIIRPNASSDLNELVRQGKLIKSSGRPVRYADHSLKWHQPPQNKMHTYKENQPEPTDNGATAAKHAFSAF
jgi:transcriptional regulator with AAA-type ATPase domain